MAITIDQKKITKQNIFKYIYYSEVPVSKPKIAADLNLSLPTVYKNITELLDEGLIVNAEIQKSTGGRPPVAYISNRDSFFAVSIAISANRLRFYVADAWRQEVGYKHVLIQSLDSVEIGKQIAEELPIFIKENHLDESKLIGLGITIPGVIDHEKNVVILSPTLKMRNIDLTGLLEQLPVHVPVIVENDSTSAGYAEKYSMRNEHKFRTFAYLFLEYGVGGAIFYEGKPYYGINHRSGEFGHAKVGNSGLLCSCGKRDCLEAYCGASRFSDDLGITMEEFIEELKKGNEKYKELWEDGLKHLAIGINSIRMTFDCDIILGGFMTEYLEPYMEQVKADLKELDPFGDETDYVQIGNFAKRAGVIGLTRHILTEYLENI